MIKAARLVVASLVVVLMSSPVFAQNSKAIGTWELTTISPEGETKSTVVISEEGGKLKAVGKSPRGERPYESIEVNGSKITLVITISYNGSPMTITYGGTIDAAKMGGEADFGGMATGTWSATAQKQ